MNYACGLCDDELCEDELCEAVETASWNLSFGVIPTREEYGDHYDAVMELCDLPLED